MLGGVLDERVVSDKAGVVGGSAVSGSGTGVSTASVGGCDDAADGDGVGSAVDTISWAIGLGDGVGGLAAVTTSVDVVLDGLVVVFRARDLTRIVNAGDVDVFGRRVMAAPGEANGTGGSLEQVRRTGGTVEAEHGATSSESMATSPSSDLESAAKREAESGLAGGSVAPASAWSDMASSELTSLASSSYTSRCSAAAVVKAWRVILVGLGQLGGTEQVR